MSTVKGFRFIRRRFTISPVFEKKSCRRDRARCNAKVLKCKYHECFASLLNATSTKQTSWLKHRISPCAHWRQPRRGCRGHIPPILLRTFEYSRPILVALRSLSLKPISFGYKTPPVRFSQTGSQSSSPQPWTGVDATTYAVLQTAVLNIDCWAWTRLLISWMIV